jgi:hypothetical protein
VGLLYWNFLERMIKSMKDLKMLSVLVEFRAGDCSIQVRIHIALADLLGKAVCRFTCIMHVYRLLVCFTQFINAVCGAQYKKKYFKGCEFFAAL